MQSIAKDDTARHDSWQPIQKHATIWPCSCQLPESASKAGDASTRSTAEDIPARTSFILNTGFFGFRHSRAGGNPDRNARCPPARQRHAIPILSPDVARGLSSIPANADLGDDVSGTSPIVTQGTTPGCPAMERSVSSATDSTNVGQRQSNRRCHLPVPASADFRRRDPDRQR